MLHSQGQSSLLSSQHLRYIQPEVKLSSILPFCGPAFKTPFSGQYHLIPVFFLSPEPHHSWAPMHCPLYHPLLRSLGTGCFRAALGSPEDSRMCFSSHDHMSSSADSSHTPSCLLLPAAQCDSASCAPWQGSYSKCSSNSSLHFESGFVLLLMPSVPEILAPLSVGPPSPIPQPINDAFFHLHPLPGTPWHAALQSSACVTSGH